MQGKKLRRKMMERTDIFVEGFSEHLSYITALCIGCSKSFRPTNQNSLIDSALTEESGEI